MNALEIIRCKRDGRILGRDQIAYLVEGAARGAIPDYQIAAWLMAVFFRGLSPGELSALTDCMLHSGERLALGGLPMAKVDKHSTGGVGDKTSLVVGPIAAAGGLAVPMISGRALGHTGGTLDKLESIPGFRTQIPLAEIEPLLAGHGLAMVGQSEALAPADRRLYALRDATGTVESPFLICASILSKKLAEDLDGLVLDVKTGSGAFMKTEAQALELARLMVETGARAGVRTVALLTDMDQPLGRAVGNALEVREALELLRGSRAPGHDDLRRLCVELAAWMFVVGDRAAGVEEGRVLAESMLSSGRAWQVFRAAVAAQGGDLAAFESAPDNALRRVPVPSPASGFVHAMDTEQIGLAAIDLGGGRLAAEDRIDPRVGLEVRKKIGDAVRPGEPLCILHCTADDARMQAARERVRAAYAIAGEPPQAARPLILRTIVAETGAQHAPAVRGGR